MALGFLDRVRTNLARAIAPRSRRSDQPPGGFSFGTSWFGGPSTTDAFQSRRAPTPWDLVERYKALIFAMAGRNRDAVSRLTLRLYADASRAQGKPSRHCDPVKVSRWQAERFARAGMVSAAAVDRVEEIRVHPMLDVLDRPDPDGYFDRRSLIGFMVIAQDILGSGYLVPDGFGWDYRAQREGKGVPEFLWLLYPQYTIPIRQPGSPLIDSWMYFADRIPFASALWFRQNISLRDPYGSAYSPAYAGDLYQDQEQRMVAIADQLLGQGPRPNLVVSAKDPMMPPGDDVLKRFVQDLNRKQAGGQAGGVVGNPGSYDFTPINQPPADKSWKDLSEYDRNCLAAIFCQPPTFYTTDTNVANLQAANKQHALFGVEPRCWAIAGKLTQFVRRFDPRLFFAFDSAIEDDIKEREEVKSLMLSSGRATINQVNEEDRWPAVPWGDEPWLAGTLKQPTMLIEAHQMGLEQTKAGIEQGQIKAENETKMTDFQASEDPAGDAESDAKRALIERWRRLGEEMMGGAA